MMMVAIENASKLCFSLFVIMFDVLNLSSGVAKTHYVIRLTDHLKNNSLLKLDLKTSWLVHVFRVEYFVSFGFLC